MSKTRITVSCSVCTASFSVKPGIAHFLCMRCGNQIEVNATQTDLQISRESPIPKTTGNVNGPEESKKTVSPLGSKLGTWVFGVIAFCVLCCIFYYSSVLAILLFILISPAILRSSAKSSTTPKVQENLNGIANLMAAIGKTIVILILGGIALIVTLFVTCIVLVTGGS